MKEEIQILEQALNQANKSGAYPTLQYAAIAYSALSRIAEYIATIEQDKHAVKQDIGPEIKKESKK